MNPELVIRTLREDGLRVGIVEEPACRRVFVDGELDLRTAPLLAAALSDAARSICIDVSGVEFCDVTGINVILEADQRVSAAGHRLLLIGVPPQLRHLLRVLALDDALTVELGDLRLRPTRVPVPSSACSAPPGKLG